MARVRRMRTQEAAFWQSDYRVSEDDLDFITGVVLESGQPRELDELVPALMLRLVHREKERAARQVSDGEVYRPADHYEIGQTLFFTERDLAQAVVVAVRPGVNPRYGSFQVVRVAFDDGTEAEFASDLQSAHPLNRPIDELVGGSSDDLPEDEIVATYSANVSKRLTDALEGDEGWVQFDGVWFLRELLPEFHVGHLNLAEAAVYEANRPLLVSEMLGRLDLGMVGSRQAQLFSLNHALSEDSRFDNVGTRSQQVWYLRTLMPEAAFARPAVHQTPFVATGDEYLGLTMLDIVESLGDELDSIRESHAGNGPSIGFQVTFPHLHAGTMPASRALLTLFAFEVGQHVPVTLIDGRNGRSFMGWLLPDEHYIAGLGPWFKSVGMVVGGLVTVTPGEEPASLKLSVTVPRTASSGWVRSASVSDGALVIQMQPGKIAIRHDPATLIEVADRDAIARLMWQSQQTSRGLYGLVRAVFAELAKLSPQGVASCQAIYSAVNMYRRSGAVPVFSILTRNACFDPAGNGDWAYDGSLEGQQYETPEEMRERPLSHRSDLARDQVVRYAGSEGGRDGA
jgi:hypothetical protein